MVLVVFAFCVVVYDFPLLIGVCKIMNESEVDKYDQAEPISNLSKYHKPDTVGRKGRLYRGEKKYRNHRTHTGKGVTLRSHRKNGSIRKGF